MQVSTTFATNSNLSPSLAVWIPNILYMILAGILLYKAND
jgi:lipopolysaccharide export LptBFGC system permease protein LptF